MDDKRSSLYQECKKKLIKTRQDLLGGLRGLEGSLSIEISGDEGDMAKALDDQHSSLMQREKLMSQLREIDFALERIEQNRYGMCEETEEPIESERLKALPWTRLSLAGAEIRERNRKRFAS